MLLQDVSIGGQQLTSSPQVTRQQELAVRSCPTQRSAGPTPIQERQYRTPVKVSWVLPGKVILLSLRLLLYSWPDESSACPPLRRRRNMLSVTFGPKDLVAA